MAVVQRRERDVKNARGKRKVVVLLDYTYRRFLPFSLPLPSPSSLLKLPNKPMKDSNLQVSGGARSFRPQDKMGIVLENNNIFLGSVGFTFA